MSRFIPQDLRLHVKNTGFCRCSFEERWGALLRGTASAIFVAMYLPWLFMTGAFMLRTRHNIKKMLAGKSGPWLKTPAEYKDSDSSVSE